MALGRLEKAEKYLAMALRWEKNAMFEKAYQDVRQAITARYAQLRGIDMRVSDRIFEGILNYIFIFQNTFGRRQIC
jgi:hypothetical protein